MPWRPVRTLGSVAALVIGIGVSTGPTYALDRLEFLIAGADDTLEAAVRAASLLASLEKAGQTDPQDLIAAARADYGRILAALYAQGHYSAVIRIRIDSREAAAIPPLDIPQAISTIVIEVIPGQPFGFDTARIAPLAEGTVLPMGFRAGLPAESGLVGKALDAAILSWRNAGHAKAAAANESVVADHATGLLDVDLRLDPGPILRFGPLTVDGADRMRENRVRKIAGLPVGETFSETELLLAQERLRRTGIFSSVTLIEDETVSAPDLLGVTASVVEQKPRRYSLGAEIASLDGMSLQGSWLHRNLMGGGERLKIESSATKIGFGESGVDYAIGLSLDRPATLGPDTSAGISLDYAHLDETDYSVDSFEFGLNLVHVFSDRMTGKVGFGYSYQNGTDPGGDFTYRNLSVPVSLTWDRRDDPRDAKRGFYLDTTAMPFLGFGTTGSGLRGTFDGRAYRSLGQSGDVVLALRAQGGAVIGPDLLETPRDLLFLSGGGGTVRGQPYRSLGVLVDNGPDPDFEIGGKYFLGASVELRVKVTERIGVVGFVDAGSIGLDGFLDGTANLHAGAGLGVRYDTGFGPIRLDVAAPISGDTGDGVQIYFGLGQAF